MGRSAIFALSAAMALGAALPGFALPYGPIMKARATGYLGSSGLYVETTPQSLLVTRIAKGSPAAAAGLTLQAPPQRSGKPAAAPVFRILTVNGRPVADLTTAQLRGAFRGHRVALVLGQRAATDVEERTQGPVVLELYPRAAARAYDMAGRGQWLRALDVAKSEPGLRAEIVSRMLFEAQRLASQGEPGQALKVLALVPRDEQGHDRALELSRQYDRVTREARKR
jgi:hypothetical protein